jgi:hypothetical protein
VFVAQTIAAAINLQNLALNKTEHAKLVEKRSDVRRVFRRG